MTQRLDAGRDAELAWISPRLATWASELHGPRARVSDVWPLPGNSGRSYRFTLTAPGLRERLVIRLPPAGVALSRNADVIRQARILETMGEAGIPVPEVRASSADGRLFDVPFYVATLVPGSSTHLFDPELSGAQDGRGLEGVFRAGMGSLAAIHAVDWRSVGWDWAEPQDLAQEIRAWTPTLLKSDNAEWVALAREVGDLLMASRPADPEPTVVHGDFYSNNWLFEDGEITAILDWEIAGIGPPGLDLGWICMIYDERSWGPRRHRWDAWTPTPELLMEAYTAAGGRPVDDLGWYRALAGYRLACITARNYFLHTSGKRPDPAWEVIADSFTRLVGRARELVLSS